jgi:phage/plasmid-associated DNA primase
VIDDPDGTVPAGWLYERYVTWAKATGENVLSQRAFSARLSERGLKTSSRLEPVTRRKVYRGFRLADGSEGPQL